ncbi:uncharacterized protein LOC122040436 [Zingiber officinale]|uniref:uncharacterized protein LOC122040436 n=1 Tax=Zingiber officinale TaxID=94328 RepID=UPI001C4C91A4|nr:uncharacterized protein LOC122040436 [Zingiber officinale]
MPEKVREGGGGQGGAKEKGRRGRPTLQGAALYLVLPEEEQIANFFITSQQPFSSSDLKRRVHPSFNNPFIFRFEEKVSFSIDEQPSTSSTAFVDRLTIREAPSSSPLSTTDSKRIWLSLAHYCSWNWRPSDLSKAAQGLFYLGATYRSSTIIPRVPFQIF